MTSPSLSSKSALVTGAGSGIGAATARLLAQQGARVLCTDLKGHDDTASSIAAAGGQASACRLDVTSESDWDALLPHLPQGQVDIVVASAGIAAACPLGDLSFSEWRRVLAVNLDGAFLATRFAVRQMGKRGGSIVLVSSASGIRPPVGSAAYSTSKAGVCFFARAAAKELREAGMPIRVNTVCPGGVKTPMWAGMPFFRDLIDKHGSEEAAFASMASPNPFSRFADPEEIAQAIVFLCGDAAGLITGTDLVIDGGYVL